MQSNGKRAAIMSTVTLTGAILLLLTIVMMTTASASAQEKVLHSFTSSGGDGAYPLRGGLIFDAAGNLYGTTTWGGTYGNGTVFEITP